MKRDTFTYNLRTNELVTLVPIYKEKTNKKTGITSTYLSRYETVVTQIEPMDKQGVDVTGIARHAVNSVYLVKRVGRLDKKDGTRKGGNSQTEIELQYGNILQGHDRDDVFQTACLAVTESYYCNCNHTGLSFEEQIKKLYIDARRAVNTLIGGIQRRRVQDANTDGRLRDTYETQAWRQAETVYAVLNREHIKYVLSRIPADEKLLFSVWYKLYRETDFNKEPSANSVRRALGYSEEKRKTLYRRIRSMKKHVIQLWRAYNVEGYNGKSTEIHADTVKYIGKLSKQGRKSRKENTTIWTLNRHALGSPDKARIAQNNKLYDESKRARLVREKSYTVIDGLLIPFRPFEKEKADYTSIISLYNPLTK